MTTTTAAKKTESTRRVSSGRANVFMSLRQCTRDDEEEEKEEEKKMMKHFCYLAHRNRHSSVDNLHTHCNRRGPVDVSRAGRLIYFSYARCPVRLCVGSISSRFDSVFPLHSVSLEFTLVLLAFNYTCCVAFSRVSLFSLSLSISLSLCIVLLACIFF